MYPVNYNFNYPKNITPTLPLTPDDQPIDGVIDRVSSNGSGFFHPTHQPDLTIFIYAEHMGGATQGSHVQIVKGQPNFKGPTGKVISVETVPQTPPIQGTIDTISSDGSAYCRSAIDESFIFVRRQYMNDASQDDIVLVRILLPGEYPRYPEGEIIKIFQRARTALACIVDSSNSEKTTAYSPLLKRNLCLQPSESVPKLITGMRVLCTVNEWGRAPDAIQATVTSSIGTIENPTSDVSFIIAEYGLPRAFPQEVIQMDEDAIWTETPMNLWTPYADLQCCSIDSQFTSTFDDAISLEQTPQGDYILGVHVADVAHYVPPDSAIDREARFRGQTTYLPGHIIPMLPPTITDTLCSLIADTARLTMSVFSRYTREGRLIQTGIQRTLITNQYNFSHDQVRDILYGTNHPYKKNLHLMQQLCQLLRQARQAPEARELASYHIGHQIVEEFMLQANQIVALRLKQTQTSAVFRTVSTNINTAKPLATYTTEQTGHAQLAFSPYCHFTSPLRRYTDLTTHRLLFDAEALEEADINELALLANVKEQNSKKAEKAMRWMQTLRRAERLYEHSSHSAASFPYRASITKVSSTMVSFEVTLRDSQGPFCLEGVLPIASIPHKQYQLGETLFVQFQGVDLIHQHAKWSVVL